MRPSRAFSLPISAALAALWILLRTVVFSDFLFPLTYVLPLLVCVWSRDRVVLWGMALLFAGSHTLTQPWIQDARLPSGRVEWATYVATLINIGVAAVVVHAIIGLRQRLERSLHDSQVQSEELQVQQEELEAQNGQLRLRTEEIVRLNAALREKDRRKDEFLATLSHELRNPLTPMRFALQLLDKPRRFGQPEPRAVIERQVNHLGRLIDDLLDATRINSNKIQVRKRCMNLGPLVSEAVAAVRTQIDAARHRVEVSVPATPIWVDGDSDRLLQMLTNLLNNAVRYTPPGGRIGVTATVIDNTVSVSVSDNGLGLAPADQTRVFEMFTQVAGPGAGGLGIGLALVKGIVELHGGSVEARSAGIGHGSQFTVQLPLVPAPAPEVAKPVAARAAAPSSRRVLVVDDNPDAAEMIEVLLTTQGHVVQVARDGAQAVAAATGFRPDVALLDIGLPGIDGYEVARRLRAHPATGRAFLVAVTGWGEDADQELAREAGFDAHVTKPPDPDEIIRLVDSAPSGAGGV